MGMDTTPESMRQRRREAIIATQTTRVGQGGLKNLPAVQGNSTEVVTVATCESSNGHEYHAESMRHRRGEAIIATQTTRVGLGGLKNLPAVQGSSTEVVTVATYESSNGHGYHAGSMRQRRAEAIIARQATRAGLGGLKKSSSSAREFDRSRYCCNVRVKQWAWRPCRTDASETR